MTSSVSFLLVSTPTSRSVIFRKSSSTHMNAVTSRFCILCTVIRNFVSLSISQAGCWIFCSNIIRRIWRCCVKWSHAGKSSCSAQEIPSRYWQPSPSATGSASSEPFRPSSRKTGPATARRLADRTCLGIHGHSRADKMRYPLRDRG